MSFLHCKKYQYGVFLLLRGLTASPCSSSSPVQSSRYCSSWRTGLLFLKDLLDAISVDREPNSGGPEGEFSRSASPREQADRDTDLACRAASSPQGVCVRNLDKGACDKSGFPIRVRGSGDFLTTEKTHSLAPGADIFLPFRTHKLATAVNMFSGY